MDPQLEILTITPQQKNHIYQATQRMGFPFVFNSGERGEPLEKIIPDVQALMMKTLDDSGFNIDLSEIVEGKKEIALLKNFPTGITPGTPKLGPGEGYTWQPKGILPTFLMLGLAGKMGIGLSKFTMFAVPPYKVEGGVSRPEIVHTDSCQYNILFCLRGNEEAVTGYMSFSDILSDMPKELRDELFEVKFRVRGKPEGEFFPVFYKDEKRGRIMPYYTDSIQSSKPTTDIGMAALKFISDQRNSEKAIRLTLEQGDVLVFDNTAGVHWRDEFRTNKRIFDDAYGGSPDTTVGEKAHFSATDRFVITMFLPASKEKPIEYKPEMEDSVVKRISEIKSSQREPFILE